MLSMKHKLQLMQFVQGYEGQAPIQDLLVSASEYLANHNNDANIKISTADLKEACKNADMKWSAICSTGTSPVALLHIKVAELLADRDKLQAQLNEMKHDLNDMKHQVRTMKETLSPLRLVQP